MLLFLCLTIRLFIFYTAKASLTASRTAANSIYVSPLLQAEIDEMSGILACEEGDCTTAYSYFLEAFEAYDHGTDSRALTCLKYMLLAKVLSNHATDVPAVMAGKLAVKHKGPEIDAMLAIAHAAKQKSLEDFTSAVSISIIISICMYCIMVFYYVY